MQAGIETGFNIIWNMDMQMSTVEQSWWVR